MKGRKLDRWRTKVRGVVAEHDGDGWDPPSRLVIITADEEEYFVVDDETGRELEELVDEEVEAQCFMHSGDEGRLFAEVLEVRVPAWELDDPEYDGDVFDWDEGDDVDDDEDEDEDTEDFDEPVRKRRVS